MLTLPRKLVAAISAASLLGVFSTTVLPTVSGDGAQAHAAAKKKKKKATVRSRQS